MFGVELVLERSGRQSAFRSRIEIQRHFSACQDRHEDDSFHQEQAEGRPVDFHDIRNAEGEEGECIEDFIPGFPMPQKTSHHEQAEAEPGERLESVEADVEMIDETPTRKIGIDQRAWRENRRTIFRVRLC